MSVDAPPNTRGGGLNAKFLGLPTWGWIALAAAAGIGVAVWLRSRGSGSPPETQTVDPGSEDQDTQQAILDQLRDLHGDASVPTAATPSTPPLPAPTNLKFTSVTTKHAMATWSPVPGAVKYHATWQDRTKTGTNVPLAPVNDHFYNLNKGDTVTLQVFGIPASGQAGTPATISTTIK